jgi:hypothetical protein
MMLVKSLLMLPRVDQHRHVREEGREAAAVGRYRPPPALLAAPACP